jgi:hypothetical protein
MLIQVPHFGDTVQVPHFGDTVRVPYFGDTVQVPNFGDTVQVSHSGDTLQVPQFCDTVQFRHQKIRTGVGLLNLVKIQMPVEPTPGIEISISILVFHQHDRTTGSAANGRCRAAQLISFAIQASVNTWTTQRRSSPLTAEILDYECQRFLVSVHIKISMASAPSQPDSDEPNFNTRFQS